MTKRSNTRSAVSASTNTGVALLTGQSPAERDEHTSADEQIRIRAYELYRERGNAPGDDLRDWLEAEREYSEQL